MKVLVVTNRFEKITESFKSIGGLTLGGSYNISDSEIVVRKIISGEKSFGDISPHVIELVISFGLGCSSSVLANWIYDNFGRNSKKILIDEEETKLEVSQIEKTIMYKIKTKKSHRIEFK